MLPKIVPLLASLIISKLKRMSFNVAPEALCVLLIKPIERKFKYVLDSEVYLVLSLFDSKNLSLLTKRSYSKDVKIFASSDHTGDKLEFN